ncbi:MAG: hypothetical protein ACE5GE_01895 [Phycisphaerae bacterium]
MTRGTRLAGLCLSISANAALASPVFLGTLGPRLLRTDGINPAETFRLSDDIAAMAVGPDGTIWAASRSDDDRDGFREIYTLQDPLGPNPTLQFYGDFLADFTSTITFVGDTLYGFQRNAVPDAQASRLVRIDLQNQTQSVVGQTGLVGAVMGGSGYDPQSDTLLMSSLIITDGLWDVDYALQRGDDPSATLVNEITTDIGNHGAEFFEGTYFMLAQLVNGPLVLGSLDPQTAQFNPMQELAPRSDRVVSLVVLPEPNALGLLLAGLFLATSRRR